MPATALVLLGIGSWWPRRTSDSFGVIGIGGICCVVIGRS